MTLLTNPFILTLLVEDENGIPSIRYLKTLKHFADNIHDENTTDFSILEPINYLILQNYNTFLLTILLIPFLVFRS